MMNAILLLLASVGQTPVPALVCETPTAQLGELKAGAPLTHSFKLINNSPSQTVALLGVKVSCGCTKHGFDRKKLKPGESATLAVQINTLAQAAGPWSWTAHVEYKTDGTAVGSLQLALTANLVREISITPPGLAISLESGTVTQDVVIEDRRAVPLTIKGVSPSSPHLKALLSADSRPGQHRITITVNDDTPLGEHRETIVLVTGDPLYPELHVPVQVSKKHPAMLKAYPAELFWDSDSQTARATAATVLRRVDGKPLQIATIIIDHPDFVAKWSKDSALTQTVRVQAPTPINKFKRVDMTITLQEPAGEVLVVPVYREDWDK